MDILKNSKKVFHGVLHDVYQWDQEMYDGSSKVFEMIVRKSSVAIIAVVENKIIVLSQEQPTKPIFPALPGGFVESGQTHIEAARAELMQETGYECSDINLLAEFFGGTKMYFHQSVFIAKGCKEVKSQNLDGGEKIEVTLQDFDTFLQLCREEPFGAPLGLKFMMYEALIDPLKKEALRNQIFGV